jgi:hypothetical protein
VAREQLTAQEIRQLRHLLKKGGYPPIEQLRPKHGGRRKRKDDWFLDQLELFVHVAKRELNMDRTPAIRWFAGSLIGLGVVVPSFEREEKRGPDPRGKTLGKSADAFAARLAKKLNEAGFPRLDIKELLPPGDELDDLTVLDADGKLFGVAQVRYKIKRPPWPGVDPAKLQRALRRAK